MKNILSIACILLSVHCIAQKTGKAAIDSMIATLPASKEDSNKIKTLSKIGLLISDVNANEGIKYANQSIALSKKIKWEKGLSGGYLALSRNYMILGNNESAEKYMQQSLQTSKKLNDMEGEVNALLTIGFFYVNIGKVKQAIDYFEKSQKIGETIHNKNLIGKSYYGLGMVHQQFQDWESAKKSFQQSMIFAEELNDKAQMTVLYNRLGIILKKQGNIEDAIIHYKKAYQLAKELGLKNGAAGNLLNLGIIYYEQKQYQQAIRMVKSALDAGNEMNDIRLLGSAQSTLGAIYFSMAKDGINTNNSIKEAIDFFEAAITSFKMVGEISSLQETFSNVAEAYEWHGDYQKALNSYKDASIYKDSIFKADTKQTIKDLENKRAIETRDKQIQINQLALKNERRTRAALIAGAALLLMIGGLLFYQNQHRRKTNTILLKLNAELDEANKVKTKFFGILSHDLRSPIASLINFLHLQKEVPDAMDAASAVVHREQLTNAAENLLETMETMLLWSKSQMEYFAPQKKIITVAALFSYLQKQFSGLQHIQFKYNNPLQLSVSTDEDYIKTILYNLTNNAVNALKNTADAKIEWSASAIDQQQILLSISDNGPGVNKEQIDALYNKQSVVGTKHGLGLHIIRDLASAIQCKINIQSNIGKGASFNILLNAV